jgi:hypothetical protein
VKLNRCSIENNSISIEVTLYPDEAPPEPGSVVQLGVELPAIPGLRGVFLVSDVSATFPSTGDLATADLRLVPSTIAALEQSRDAGRVRELLDRDHGPTPNWAAVWDELEFLPAHRRADVMAEIQRAQRDRAVEATRMSEILAAAQQRAEEQRAAAESRRAATEQQVQQVTRKIVRDRLEHEFKPKTRKINLDDDLEGT